MPGLVVFLHGLMGTRHSWGAVPDFVQGSDFDVFTPTYNAALQGRSDVETSAQLIITALQTNYPNHEPIYLVGHSLGGLVAREICRYLLLNGPDALLNKIPAAITAGTPLEGARYGNCLLRYIPFLSPKIHQIATTGYAFDDYRDAIRAAKTRHVSRPKQLHIRMEEDGVIGKQVAERFTEDDFAAAVIPGTHTNFNDNNSDAKYVADVILRLIRNTQNSLSAPNISRPAQVEVVDLPDRLILIACSHTKELGGHIGYNGQPVNWVVEPNLRQRIIAKRSYVFGVLKDAKLADGFERGGNRAHQLANQSLRHGPDLGGMNANAEEISYLPAWQRYRGRIYVPVADASWRNYLQNRHKIRVLIMSGLYGLIEPEELIQNYDVHLTDTHIESGNSVSSMWTELYTECIENYVRHAYRDRKVHIFNLLCDHHYVDAVKWHKLPRECSVFHLASPTIEDIALLPPALLNAFLADPGRLEAFDRTDRDKHQYQLSDYGVPPPGLADARIVFESRVGISKSAE
jgi:pimeloyl-ACP methyl ester carboxylesterase